MNKGLFPIALALILILQACGGAEDENKGPIIDKDFSSGIKGLDSQPEVTLLSEEFADHDINVKFSGNLNDNGGSFATFYNPANSQYTAAVLNYSHINTDVVITDMQSGAEQHPQDEWPIVIFEAEAGKEYRISANTTYGDGNFDLLIIEPNRESLKLSNNEYLVHFKGSTYSSDCTVGEGDEQIDFYRIINWKDGYMRNINKSRAINFSYVPQDEENTFWIDSDQYRAIMEPGDNLQVTTDFSSGAISYEKTYTRLGYAGGPANVTRVACYFKDTTEGEIVL